MHLQAAFRRIVPLVCSIAVAACSTTGSAPADPSGSAVQVRPPIALVADPTPPAITTTSTVPGIDAGAQSGMARGAGVCDGFVTSYPIGPSLALACLPFGLSIGAAVGASTTAELAALELAEASLKRTIGSTQCRIGC